MCFAYDIVDHSFVLETSCVKRESSREMITSEYLWLIK